MNLKYLSDEQLDTNLGQLVESERETLSKIILHVADAERRRLYLRYGYPSLFCYLTERKGYSNGSAQRRIDAARLLLDVPSVAASLDNGNLQLEQVSLVQKAIRQIKKETRQNVSKEQKRAVIEKIEQRNFKDSQILVAQHFQIKIKDSPKEVHQRDKSVRLEVTLTEQQWNKLERIRELFSNSLPDGSWDLVLEKMADKLLSAKEIKGKRNEEANQTELTSKLTEMKVAKKAISRPIKRAVLADQRACQYRDPKTDKLCVSRWKLNIDHIKPVWTGGSNEIENLQVLCANHNRDKYRREVGIRRI